MDAFFVGVERLRRPELRGKPVIVATGTDPHARGVVMAASYEARRFGVHSALPLSIAHRRCPQAILIPRDMALYRESSRQVMGMLERYSDRVEVAGLDEAYLDLSEAPLPKSCCRRIKHDIRLETGLTCSVGLAPNKLLAKIASDLDKPDGFYVLRQEEMLEAVGTKPAGLIPGVGPKTVERLARMGISTVAELATAPSEKLERAFGPRLGRSLHARANGNDDRPVETERERKSESRETTFSHDVDDPEVLRATLDRLVEDLCRNLASGGHRGRTITLKIRLRPFRTYTRSRTIEHPTAEPATIGAVARELLDNFEIDAPVRLLGVGLASLLHEATDPEEEEGVDETARPRLALG
jgi:nucleotidyltransferase/DNA polymerase involved in DNA repair